MPRPLYIWSSLDFGHAEEIGDITVSQQRNNSVFRLIQQRITTELEGVSRLTTHSGDLSPSRISVFPFQNFSLFELEKCKILDFWRVLFILALQI